MSIDLKAELSKFFRTRPDFEQVELMRWICHEFGDWWQTSDWLIATAKDAEDALAEWLDNYDPGDAGQPFDAWTGGFSDNH